MRYMLLMCGNEEDDGPEAHAEEAEPCWMPWAREMQARGVLLVEGSQLQPTSTATTVRTNGSEILVADGPFAETKEQMGGFWVIQAHDMDAAFELAGRASAACERPIEVRPLQG